MPKKPLDLLEPVERIPGRRGRPSKAAPVVEAFLKTKSKAMRVKHENWSDRKVSTVSIVTSLRAYINENKKPVVVIQREGMVYLERKDVRKSKR